MVEFDRTAPGDKEDEKKRIGRRRRRSEDEEGLEVDGALQTLRVRRLRRRSLGRLRPS